MTGFWYLITALGVIAAAVNFILAAARRRQPMTALVRAVAGCVSLALSIGIVVGKASHAHPPFPLEWETVFIATGVFVFAVLWLPSSLEKSSGTESGKVTMQQRAARPAKATIRLQQSNTDEWVN